MYAEPQKQCHWLTKNGLGVGGGGVGGGKSMCLLLHGVGDVPLPAWKPSPLRYRRLTSGIFVY